MQKRTEYRRWANNQLIEEYVLIEGDGGVLLLGGMSGEQENKEETESIIECGFRGEYGETEDILEDEDSKEDPAP